MKKILFFVESFTVGGAEKSLVSLLNNLDYSNYEVHLMVIKRGGDFEQFVPKDLSIQTLQVNLSAWSRIKFKVVRILNKSKKYHTAQLFWQTSKKDVPTIEFQYDVAIAWGQGFATYFVANKIKSHQKYAWVNTDYHKVGYKWQKDIDSYLKFDKVVGISDFVTQSMQQFLKKEKLITIANIIDRDDIESKSNDTINFKFDTHKINIVSVGRLQPYKGFDNAIHALKILIQKQNHNVHLYIVGEGPERTNLEQLIIKNNLKNQCTLLGLIENPYPYMKNCDIYLQTSRFEGLGRTIIEASILNKPIVCTDFPTAFSILEHEKTGLIVPMQPEAIATAIQKLINDVDFSKSLTQNLENQKNNSKQKTLEDVKALLESN